MKQYKKRITELHGNSLRFVFGALTVYYVIQFILHLAVKEGVIYKTGVSIPCYEFSVDQENQKYLVDIY